MKIAITVVALVEIAVLLASVVALLALAVRKIVRGLRNFVRPEQGLSTQGSGSASIHVLLAQLGMQASDEDVRKIAAAVTAHARKSRKTMLSRTEFRELAQSVLNRAA